MSRTFSQRLSEKLSESRILADYEAAFAEATGLPLKFSQPGKKRVGMRGKSKRNPFCEKMAESLAGCKMCLEVQEQLQCESNCESSVTVNCPAGLTDSAVPVKFGDKVIGYLQTGQVALRALTMGDFERVIERFEAEETPVEREKLEKTFFQTRVVPEVQYKAAVELLKIFAKHLSIAAEQIAVQETNVEPQAVQRARKFIEDHQADDITLDDVARAVSTSTFHFCKLFKKATGMTFTEHLSMVRIHRAKQLLANPQMRVSEIVFECGFASLTHFNRVFKKVTGQSPTQFRRSQGIR